MYVPEHFELPADLVADYLSYATSAQLITPDLDATVIPFTFRSDIGAQGAIRTHLSKVNPQWQASGEALIILSGPLALIRPEFLPSARTDPTVVPTLNYVTVQARGQLSAHHDEEWKLAQLADMTAKYTPDWDMTTVPDDYFEKYLPAMVGVEVVLDSVVGKAKLSQNRTPTDVLGIINALEDSSDTFEIADLMRSVALPHAVERAELIQDTRLRAEGLE